VPSGNDGGTCGPNLTVVARAEAGSSIAAASAARTLDPAILATSSPVRCDWCARVRCPSIREGSPLTVGRKPT